MGTIRRIKISINVISIICTVGTIFIGIELYAAPKKASKPVSKTVVAPILSEPISLFKEATFLLPKDANISSHWILPPSHLNLWKGNLTIDQSGSPLISRYESSQFQLIKPLSHYIVEVDTTASNMMYMDNGVLLLSSANMLGFLAESKEKKFNDKGIPWIGFQPITSFPLKSIDVISNFENVPYCAGFNSKTKRYSIYALRSIKGSGLNDIELIYESDEPITSMGADKESILVAIGQKLIRIARSDGKISQLYTHPTEVIIDIAVQKDGVFAGTKNEIVYIGQKGTMEIMRSSGHRMIMRQNTLYVLFENSTSVLAVENLIELNRFNLAVQPASAKVTVLPLSVTDVHFFESSVPPYSQKIFAASFNSANIRKIVAQIDLKMANISKKSQHHTLTASWYEPVGGKLLSVSYPLLVNSGSATKQMFVSIGEEPDIKGYIHKPKGEGGLIWKSGKDALGSRYPGKYRLSIQLDGVSQGEWFFSISGEATFIDALFYNDIPTLRTLLSQKPSSDYKNSEGIPYLHLAVDYGSIEAVQLLLDMGANPNEMDKNGLMPLQISGMSRVTDGIKKAELLIQRGANVNAVTGEDKKPLIHAVYNAEYVIFLLKNGADINAKDPQYKNHTVADRIINGHSLGCSEELINILVSKGFNLNTISQSHFQLSFLGAAIERGDDDCVSNLLQRGVSTSVAKRSEYEERSALYLALKKLNSRVTGEYGSKPSSKEIDKSRRIVQLLIEKGAKVKPGKKYLTTEYFYYSGFSSISDDYSKTYDIERGIKDGEGRMMFVGESPQYFTKTEMIEVLKADDSALDEASKSLDESVRTIALQTHMERIREITEAAKHSWYLYKAHEHCEEAFKMTERKYPLKQLTLVADTYKNTQSLQSNLFSDVLFITRADGGVYIQQLSSDGAAWRSGLRTGDIVLAIDTQKIKDANDAISVLAQLPMGMPSQITFLRDEPMIMPELQLTCGILEKAKGDKALASMNLTRWITNHPDASNIQEITDLLNEK